MYELRNTETGEVITDPAIAHGPMYDPLGHFVSYVIAIDRKAVLSEIVKFLLVNAATGEALVSGTVERNGSLSDEQSIWRLMPSPAIVGDSKAPPLAHSGLGVLGFLLARDLNQAKAVMEAKGFPLVHGYEAVWRDPNGVNLLFVDRPTEMRGRTVAAIYTTSDFDQHPLAAEMLAMAERCLLVTKGKVTVL